MSDNDLTENHDDLTDLLRNWPFETGRINARQFRGRDGRIKIQVRIDLGVLQMEATARPDGLRPHDHPTLLAHYHAQREEYAGNAGSPDGFVLAGDDCRALREEAVQFYHRYVAWFSLGSYSDVISDAEHNLAIFDLCAAHAADDHDREVLERFRPQVIMMRGRAQAEQAIADDKPRDALAVLEQAIADIRDAFAEAGNPDGFEDSNEVQVLRGMRDALVPKLPASQRAELEDRLRAAIDAENYELAAILRDELRMM